MAQRKKSIGKQRATFSLFRQGNPAQKVGTFAFFGKSFKKAEAAGSRYLRKLGLSSNVAAGFWDDSGFHPIRASYDYSPAGRRKKTAPPQANAGHGTARRLRRARA